MYQESNFTSEEYTNRFLKFLKKKKLNPELFFDHNFANGISFLTLYNKLPKVIYYNGEIKHENKRVLYITPTSVGYFHKQIPNHSEIHFHHSMWEDDMTYEENYQSGIYISIVDALARLYINIYDEYIK